MGYQSYLCPVCGMPFLASEYFNRFSLCEAAIVMEDGTALMGTFDGLGELLGVNDDPDGIDIAKNIKIEGGEHDWGTGEHTLVHQTCIQAFVEEFMKAGKDFPELKLDPNQGFSYTDAEAQALEDTIKEMFPDFNYVSGYKCGVYNVFAQLDSDEYRDEYGSRCPACKSSNIQPSDTVGFNAIDETLGMCCLDCESEWLVEFEMTGYRNLSVGTDLCLS